jgi:hypothetical protein
MLYHNTQGIERLFPTYGSFKKFALKVGAYHRMHYAPRKFVFYNYLAVGIGSTSGR